MTGYVRQSSADIVPTAVVRAAPINNELNALRDAFEQTAGHKHDGTAAEGHYVPLIADADARNKVAVDTVNNRVGVFAEVGGAAVEQVRIQDGAIVPVTDNDIDLGTGSLEFKDLYIDGTANIDSLIADNADINAGTIDNTVVGATTPAAATFTTLTSNGSTTLNGTTVPASKTLVVTTDKLSALAATSSSELAGVISDETGSGALVFANSPTLVTPALGTPSSATLTNATGLPLTSGVTGTLPVANGGTGITSFGTGVATFLGTPSSSNLAAAVTDETGTGALVFANSPTLVTPALGTPSSATLTNATGLPISSGVSGLGTGVATFLGTPSSSNLAAAVTDETGTGALVFANSPTLVTPVLGTPSSATLTNATGLPLSSGVTGTLPITNGGTNATTAAAARTNLLPAFATNAGKVLAVNTGETDIEYISVGGTGTVTSVGGTGTVNGITLTGTVTSSGNLTLGGALSGVSLTTQVTGTLPVANGGTGVTSSTGTGSVVLSNSPTLVTPVLGTPSSGTLTNTTGLPIDGGTTGTLPVNRGGTGATSLTANNVILGNGTASVQVVAPSTSGNVLTSNGTTWVSSAPAVTLAGSETLTNKTIAYADNTLTGVQPTLVSGTSIKTINSTSLLGSGDIAIGSSIIRVARTSNTELGTANSGNLIDITSGTFTQTFAAAATLGDGWFVYIRNSGTGNITLDPSSSETIDGLTSFIMYPAEVRLIQCDGTALRSIVLNSFVATFTASGTFTKPPGYSYFSGLIWGGGGSGARTGTASFQPGHGGGGACVPFNVPNASVGSSVTVTIGAGGAARTNPVATSGSVGGTSSFGTIVSAYGGGGGGFSASANSGSGGGGGALSAGSNGTNGGTTTVLGGGPVNSAATDISNDGFGGGAGRGSTGGDSAYGGGGGNGGDSIYGGGGGANGTSVFGGAGGGFPDLAGTAPAGGGAGATTQTSSGAGARGELRIWGII